ncbi:MAG: hypothetical protein HFH23_09475 [Ruminococcus sp.]|nr:hypothetical protein [Ruminococcus sp.]
MKNNITLTIDEIHAIRKEHSTLTKDLSSAGYAKLIEEETTPVRLELKRLKKEYAEKALTI